MALAPPALWSSTRYITKLLNSLLAIKPVSTSSLTTSPDWRLTRLVEEHPQPGLAEHPASSDLESPGNDLEVLVLG